VFRSTDRRTGRTQPDPGDGCFPYGVCAYFTFPSLTNDTGAYAGDAGATVAFSDDTNPPAADQPYDWRIYDAAFCQVEGWNTSHPLDLPKTMALMVAPGFNPPDGRSTESPDRATHCSTGDGTLRRRPRRTAWAAH
jgi:hypothetical protein